MPKVVKLKTATEYEKEIKALNLRVQQLKAELFGLHYGSRLQINSDTGEAEAVQLKPADEYEKEIKDLQQKLARMQEPGIRLNDIPPTGVDGLDKGKWNAFAEFLSLMGKVMRKHSHKDANTITGTHIMEKLHEEVAELVIMQKEKDRSGPCTVEEDQCEKEEMLNQCADIANVAFLIYVLIKHTR